MVSVLITAGATKEYIDPIRYISSGSSGKQGYALAECMSKAGFDVNLVSCPVAIQARPDMYNIYNVETSAQMLETCLSVLPVDVGIFAAAVTDWVPNKSRSKLKKHAVHSVNLLHAPDIVRCISTSPTRPKLVIGFCLESESVIESAKEKLAYKHCDWIIANGDYVKEGEHTMGSDYNKISIVKKDSVKSFPLMTKYEVAALITEEIIDYFK
ncbi:phosphopantothenoylcysteine decarboxylase [Anaplasma bovis]|uniref:phosphopantothenoylcysteine decarboxylase n=1 Tax=Anaplasma bovis TaxID=186733 RepID=UPI002FEFD84C